MACHAESFLGDGHGRIEQRHQEVGAGLTGLDDPGGARPLFQQAFDLADASGNQLGRAQSLCGLAWLDAAEGHHTAATAGYRRALDIYTTLGDRLGEINTLNALSDTEQTLGRPQAAEALHARALKLARAIGNPHAVAETLCRTSTDHNPDEPRDPRSCL